MACYDIALNYAKERKQFNKPIGACQLVQTQLVDMWAEINKAQLLNLHIGRLKEQKQANFAMISQQK